MTKKKSIKWIEENDCKSIIKIIENKIKKDSIKKQLAKIQTNAEFKFDNNILLEFKKSPSDIKDEYFKRTYKTSDNNKKCISKECITKQDYERGINQYTLICDMYKQIKSIIKCYVPEYQEYGEHTDAEVELQFIDEPSDGYNYDIRLIVDKDYKIMIHYDVNTYKEFCFANPDYITQIKALIKGVQTIK